MEWNSTGPKVYLSADGDDQGSHVSAAILTGDVSKAHKLSLLINLGGRAIEKFVKATWGGKSVILGGDDYMGELSSRSIDSACVEKMRKMYSKKTGATLSCGIGSTPEEAMKAIVISKNTGKNRATFWDDKLELTYQKVVKARINELRNKLKAQSGLTESGKVRVRILESVELTEARKRRSPKTNSAGVPDNVKKHIQKQLRKLLVARKARNSRRVSKKPVKPSQKKPAAKKPGIPAEVHKGQMVDLMRQHILHHKMVQKNHYRHADLLAQRGDHVDARAHRMKAKMHFKKMMRDRVALHTAANLRPENVPHSVKSTVKVLRNVMASRVKGARAHAANIEKLKSVRHLAPRSVDAEITKQKPKTPVAQGKRIYKWQQANGPKGKFYKGAQKGKKLLRKLFHADASPSAPVAGKAKPSASSQATPKTPKIKTSGPTVNQLLALSRKKP